MRPFHDGQCRQQKTGGLDPVKPLQPLWQFVRSEFEMNYPSWFGNNTGRRSMKKQGAHEQSASPSNRARDAVSPRPFCNLFGRKTALPMGAGQNSKGAILQSVFVQMQPECEDTTHDICAWLH